MAEAKGLLLLLLLVVRVTPLCSPARLIVLCHHVVYIVIFPSHVLAILGAKSHLADHTIARCRPFTCLMTRGLVIDPGCDW